MDILSNLTIIIKTFERKKSLQTLLESIKKFYPNIPIIILDDSKKNYKQSIVKEFNDLDINYITTEFDIGLSKGRNMMVDKIKTDYFLLCEDDFEFDERTKLEIACNLLEQNNYDILGGIIYNIVKIETIYSFLWALKKPSRFKSIINKSEMISIYNGKFEQKDKDIKLYLNKKNEDFLQNSIYNTEICSNFFVARTDKIKEINGWQPENIKVGEHELFFYRAKRAKLKVGYTPMFGTKHYPKKTFLYNIYRMRMRKYMKLSWESENVNTFQMINENNNVVFEYNKMK